MLNVTRCYLTRKILPSPKGSTVNMSQLSAEAEIESLLKQLLRSINDKITAAPSTECAEEVLLHLEETDKNFHK